jgi:hypothetical protein
MLTLPVLLVALFLCVGLVYGMHGALVLDRALAESCRELAEYSYLLRQAAGFGLSFVGDNQIVQELTEPGLLTDVAGSLAGYAVAAHCVNKHLMEYEDVRGAAKLLWARLPLGQSDGEGDGGGGDIGKGKETGDDFASLFEGLLADRDDVILVLTFTPAKLNRITAMLPDSWQITITKRERAWLHGRILPPQRGQEQPAGKKGTGPLVYVCDYGVKYHMDGCQYLWNSGSPVYLNELSEAYGACSKCKPPPREP